MEPVEAAGVYEPFRHIGSYSYFDLYASYQATDAISVSLGVDNIFEKDPPVVGGEAGDTSSNSGNTFPSNYDNLGRIFKASLKVRL